MINKLTINLKRLLYRPIGFFKLYKKSRKWKSVNNTPIIFLLNIPSHGNLGDHLIALAEITFLQDVNPNCRVIKVTSADLFFSSRIALRKVKPQDILCITGGGFLGSMYEEEERVLSIVRRFPKNKIVFFPQTIYYENSDKGNDKLKRAAIVYQSHPYLYFAARENLTYQLLKSRLYPHRPNQILLLPDIGLYLSPNVQRNRSGVLFCLRNDKEKEKRNQGIIDQIKSFIDDSITYTDTYVPYPVSIECEKNEVFKKIEEFSSARLIVTDRLHGMIYSIISSTPVLAMDSVGCKVGQVYHQWLKDIPYVRFVKEEKDVNRVIDYLLSIKEQKYTPDMFKTNFSSLNSIIFG